MGLVGLMSRGTGALARLAAGLSGVGGSARLLHGYIRRLDVDSSAHVSILFPFNPNEIARGRLGRVPPPPDSLKASPLGPELRKLIAVLKAAMGGKAQNRLKVVTRESAS